MRWTYDDTGIDWLDSDNGKVLAGISRASILGHWAHLHAINAPYKRWFLRRKSARAWLMSLNFGEKEAR